MFQSTRATSIHVFCGLPPPAPEGTLKVAVSHFRFATAAEHDRPSAKGVPVESVSVGAGARFTPEDKAPYLVKNAWLADARNEYEEGSRILSWSGAALRTRIHSVLLKKNSLSFLIGPPTANPKLLRVNTPFFVPVASFCSVLAERYETRLNSYADPWNALVPDLVTTLTTPPLARPYSAPKLFVSTVNSCTESSGIVCPTEAVNVSTFSLPSSRMEVEAERIPLIAKPAPRPLCVSSVTLPEIATPAYGLRVGAVGNS